MTQNKTWRTQRLSKSSLYCNGRQFTDETYLYYYHIQHKNKL